jgi:hypothetical protein
MMNRGLLSHQQVRGTPAGFTEPVGTGPSGPNQLRFRSGPNRSKFKI